MQYFSGIEKLRCAGIVQKLTTSRKGCIFECGLGVIRAPFDG